MREDDRDGVRRVWYGVYADVRHEVARFVRRLEALKSNVLSILELDEVLDAGKGRCPVSPGKESTISADLPIYHVQRSVFIPLTNVASAQPTIFGKDGLITVEVIALVVATRHGCASDKNLALRWVVGREVSSLRYVEEFDFHRREREAHSAILHDIWWEDGGPAASLRHTIAYVPLSAQTQIIALISYLV